MSFGRSRIPVAKPQMKITSQNSIALPASAAALEQTSGGPCENRESIVPGAKVLEVMGQIGNRALFEKLALANLDSATRVAHRLTGNQDLADELVQETMLRAVRNWESFRHQSEFKTWLYRIMINAFRDQLRRKPKVDFVEVDPSQYLSSANSAESNVEAKELGEIVAELIAKLPQRQREVLVLTTYESLTNEQIAKTLNINVANVHANLSTARKKLKEWLAKKWK